MRMMYLVGVQQGLLWVLGKGTSEAIAEVLREIEEL